MLITHDRAFLRALSKATLWIDRGQVRRREAGFDGFEDWRETVWAEEDEARHKLDRKIKAEAKWAVEGISARRKRNQGRVRALAALRAERSSQIRRQGTAAMELEAGPQSGKKVIEAKGLSKAFGDKTIVQDFDLRVLRGDRVAFVGPNGVGKTTLLKMLTGRSRAGCRARSRSAPTWRSRFSTRPARSWIPNASLWDNLTGDPAMRVSGAVGSGHGARRAAPCGGLSQGLPVRRTRRPAPRSASLSGGEKARLLLARSWRANRTC